MAHRGDSSSWGCSSFSTPSKMANTEPEREQHDRHDERPEVALAAVAERVDRRSASCLARWPPSSSRTWLPVSASEWTPSASIDDEPGEDEADELGDGDAEVGQQGGEDRSSAASGRHGGVLVDPGGRAVAGRRSPGRDATGRSGARPAMTRPMASDAVAAGDGALTTCTTRASPSSLPSLPAKAKSSSRVPSWRTAWARTPLPAGTRSSSVSSGTSRCSAAHEARPAERPADLAHARCASSDGPAATTTASVAMRGEVAAVDVAPAVALAGQRRAPRWDRRAPCRRCLA